tara:strand:+ start:638 stop:1243 length:606 start_codon:yes stop_codon:yes gene_type:complete
MTEINIPDIHIPEVPLPLFNTTDIEVIGCTSYHRDTKNTGNRNLLIDDPNGVVTSCPYPSFTPLIYDAQNLIITEQQAPISEQEKLPEGKPPQAEIPKDKKKEEEYKPCPPKNAPFRQGDFKNELRLERLLKYERDITGCNAVWEKVPFIDQYIPSPSVVVSTAFIASVAATTPIILNLVKPIVKNLIKKLTKKKEQKSKV